MPKNNSAARKEDRRIEARQRQATYDSYFDAKPKPATRPRPGRKIRDGEIK